MGNLIFRVLAFFKLGSENQVSPVAPSASALDTVTVINNPEAPETEPATATPGEALGRPKLANEYEGNYAALPEFVELSFFNWMAGRSAENPVRDESFEHKIIEYLDVLEKSESGGANQIPRVPSVMMELLKRTHEENVTGSELTQIITRDVVLVAAILNEVNSSYYKVNKKVTEIGQALMMLGHNRLRMVLAKISFTPVFNDQIGNHTKVAAAKLWEESQQRALACYLLANSSGADPFMAFLAGLMKDVGIIVALRVFDRSNSEGELPSSDEFRTAFLAKSMALSARIGQIWTLPDIVVQALTQMNMGSSITESKTMAEVLQRADFVSKTSMLMHASQLSLDMNKLPVTMTKAEIDCLTALLSGQLSVANIM